MEASSFVYQSYNRIFNLLEEEFSLIGNAVPLPIFSNEIFLDVAHQARTTLMNSPVVTELDGRVMIVGDIHGNIYDLIRVISFFKKSEMSHILFLGDYVDRGEFSVDVITILFSLINLFPETYHLIRGNHEFRTVNSKYGFAGECQLVFGNDDFFNACNEAFCYMPIAAVVNKKLFCVHGGITKGLETIDQIKNMNKYIETYDDPILYGMMWADPCETTRGFIVSVRGAVAFGVDEAKKFLRRNNLTRIVRGHQMAPRGVATVACGVVVTVFSSSNYGNSLNMSAVLSTDNDDNLVSHRMNCVIQLKRDEVRFIKSNPKITNVNNSHALRTKLGRHSVRNKRSLPNMKTANMNAVVCFKNSSKLICKPGSSQNNNKLNHNVQPKIGQSTSQNLNNIEYDPSYDSQDSKDNNVKNPNNISISNSTFTNNLKLLPKKRPPLINSNKNGFNVNHSTSYNTSSMNAKLLFSSISPRNCENATSSFSARGTFLSKEEVTLDALLNDGSN